MTQQGTFGYVVQDFKSEPTLYAHTLIFKQKDFKNMMNICTSEQQLNNVGVMAADLMTGDLVMADNYNTIKDAKAEYHIEKKNLVGWKPTIPMNKLLQTNWSMVNRAMLKEFGLGP